MTLVNAETAQQRGKKAMMATDAAPIPKAITTLEHLTDLGVPLTSRGRLDRPMVLSIALAAAVFVVDLSLPLGVAAAVPYTFAVLIALRARPARFVIGVTLLCMTLTIAKVGLAPERGNTEMWKVVVNRCLALFTIGMTAFLGTKRRRSEEERQKAQEQTQLHLADLARVGRLKTAGQLAASLAHELNQPLAAIALQAEVAVHHLQMGESNGKVSGPLSEIAEQALRAATILRTLRGMVQKAEPRRLPLNVNEVVRNAARISEPAVRQAGVSLDLQLAAGSPFVLGDVVQLEQVLLNLIQNAVDAVVAEKSAPRLIEIETQWAGETVEISVSDQGIGLAEEDVERVFERFYTTKPSGMGMGLAICRSIVEAHGGRLWATPPTPPLSKGGRGGVTTFTFTLPESRRA